MSPRQPPRNPPRTVKRGKRVPATKNPTGEVIPNGTSKGEKDQLELLHHLKERVKELTALHGTVRVLQDSTKTLEEVFGEIVALIPPAWQYPEVTAARIQFEGLTLMTPYFHETVWIQRAPFVTAMGTSGSIDVVYLEQRPKELEGPFLLEERHLIDSLADSVSSYLTRREAEESLRSAHAQMQTLSRQLMQVQERERRQLAHDLHDEIGQAVTAIKMNLQAMQRIADTSNIQDTLNDSLGILDKILQRVRDLSLDLRPSLLDDLGLVPAVRWYVERQAMRAGLVAEVKAENVPQDLEPDMVVACFRIVQESITNILRHAKATKIHVTLRQEEHSLDLCIKDDGIGMSARETPGTAAGRSTLGLLGMQERAQALGGRITIQSLPGQGTEVRVRIPLRPREAAEGG
ncbi:MAG: sensor histidine kinase [Nitrospirota bacterium]|nr:sensor histidine kinase [Nitrospirota bacterium]